MVCRKLLKEFCLRCVVLAGGTGTPLSNRYIGDVNSYEVSNEYNKQPDRLDRIYLISEQRWQTETALPDSLLPATEGMSARIQHG